MARSSGAARKSALAKRLNRPEPRARRCPETTAALGRGCAANRPVKRLTQTGLLRLHLRDEPSDEHLPLVAQEAIGKPGLHPGIEKADSPRERGNEQQARHGHGNQHIGSPSIQALRYSAFSICSGACVHLMFHQVKQFVPLVFHWLHLALDFVGKGPYVRGLAWIGAANHRRNAAGAIHMVGHSYRC